MKGFRSPEETSLENEVLLATNAYCSAVRRGRLTDAQKARKARAKAALYEYRVKNGLLNPFGARKVPERDQMIPAAAIISRLNPAPRLALSEISKAIGKAKHAAQRAEEGGRPVAVYIQRLDKLLAERARLKALVGPMTGSPSVRATSATQITAPDLTKVSDLERAKARDCAIAWAAEKADRKAEIARKRAENAARTAAILAGPTKARGPTTRVVSPPRLGHTNYERETT
jgi:hypothetical protein